MIISDTAIRNRTTVLVGVVVVIAAGVYSYISLPREAAPDVPIPRIIISTAYEGVSPEDVETSVTVEIEKELTGIKGVKEITSTSAEGISIIVVEFNPDIRIEDALQYVRDKVDLAKGGLPQVEARKEPVIKEINVAEFPIMLVSLSGTDSPVRLKAMADELEDAIEQVAGVLNVDVLGALEPEIRLEVDPDRLDSYGLTLAELMKLLPSENVNVSAGGLETPGTKFNVRVPQEITTAEEVDSYALAQRQGKIIYLPDVAKVRDTFKDRMSFSRLDGNPSVTLSIQKSVGADIVRIARTVKAILEEARKQAPPGVQLDLILDQSEDIEMMVKDLENNILSGLILVVGVLMVFMGLRTSMIVAAAIPLSMLMSFPIIQALGYTFNMIVLFSLILALGMLVDNAIVIVENIFRHRTLGLSRVRAAMVGTSEVAWPVITSTLTTVAAFCPMMFWPGIMGDFMKYLPITVSITLTCSLIVAMVISPTLAAMVGGGGGDRRRDPGRPHWILRAYGRVLDVANHHWATTLAVSVLVLIGLAMAYAKWGYGVELFPDIDPRRAIVNVRMPQGTNIEETDRLARVVEGRLKKYAPATKHIVTNVGSSGEGFDFGGSAGGPHIANLSVMFIDYEDRPSAHYAADVVKEIRADLTDIPGAEVKVEKEREGPPTGAPVTVRVIGRDFAELERLSAAAKDLIADVPGLVNLRSDLEATRPELAFKVDQARATKLGLDTLTIGTFLKTALFGTPVSTYRRYNDEYDITVRLPVEYRDNIDDLLRLRVINRTGQSVPLSSLGEFQYRGGLGTINRVDQKRVVTLTADAEGRLDMEVLADVERRLAPLGDPTIATDDVKDWPELARRLVEAGQSDSPPREQGVRVVVGKRMWELLEKPFLAFRRPDAQAILSDLAAGKELDPARRKELLAAINQRIIDNPKFYQQEAFGGLELPEEAQKYVKRGVEKLSLEEQRRLNRLVVEGALPGLIVSRGRIELPAGYAIEYAGQKEEMDKAMSFLSKAFVLALLLIVMILVMQFNTLSVPVVIMTTVILSMIGVMAGLLVCHMPFGVIMTGVAVISLAGVVVNNAIVLLDCTRQLQRQGMDVFAAARQAGATRLRPVFLTAITTVLGLVPMAIGVSIDFYSIDLHNLSSMISARSESSQWWKNLAIAVIFGLSFATMLTLVVVPTLYTVLYRAAARFGLGGLRKVGEEEGPQTQAAASPAPMG